jgi:uncharacterized membrane protein YbhN (UPF0104 family)
MWDVAVDLAAALDRALAGVAEAVTGVAPGWLALGALLHVANQVARGRGWYAILRAASHDDPDLRRRDAIAAWVAGAGAGGIASARGGDAVRVLLLAPRLPRTGGACVTGTIVAEGAGELALGSAMLAVAVAVGLGPAVSAPSPALWMLVVPLAIAALVLCARGSRRLRRVAAGVGRGCAPLREPGRFARAVLPWQLLSRLCRGAAIACFLAAFGLPVTVEVVLLVMLAQGGARLLPFAPASVGAGAAMLAAAFEPVTGTAAAGGQVAAFFVGTSTVLTIVGTVLSLVICVRSARWSSTGELLRALRRAPAPAAAYASASAGRNAGVATRRSGLERRATIPRA